jgi:hypothetical protein
MVELVVTAEQAKLLTEAKDGVEIVDAQGNRLGFFARQFSDRDLSSAQLRASSGQIGRSTADVLERLQSLGNQ